LPVGRPPAGDAGEHPARADGLAVAGLEIRTGDPPAHAARLQSPAASSAAAVTSARRGPNRSSFSPAIKAATPAINTTLDIPRTSSAAISPAQQTRQFAPYWSPIATPLRRRSRKYNGDRQRSRHACLTGVS